MHAIGQSLKVKADSTQQSKITRKDTTKFYKSIEAFSRKNKFTLLAYRLLFESATPTQHKGTWHGAKARIQKPYSSFEGKIIRHITIQTLDPFGNSIGDSIRVLNGTLSKVGNKAHRKTRKIAIRNLLLIRQNMPFDSLLVIESERLVRTQKYITDVSFFCLAAANQRDSVDIFIRVLDNWSIIPNGSFSNERITAELYDKNFMGLGHDFGGTYINYYPKGSNAINFNYYIPNIQNSYINSTLHYGINEYGNTVISYDANRPFFSSYAKWAAGLNLTKQFYNDISKTSDSIVERYALKFITQDYWVGKATKIFKGYSEFSRTTNLVTSIRYSRIYYQEKPIAAIDTMHRYQNEHLFLASIGISSRKYNQDNYIFMYGITEDVPIGKIFSVTAGYQNRDFDKRLYLGAQIAFGSYHSWGYLSSDIQYGIFLNSMLPEQGVVNASFNYFTGIKEIGRWKFRQFIKPQVTIGLNRFAYDSLTLNKGYGLDGYNSPTLSGNSRIVLTLQTQSYAPWNLYGFRFGPFFNYSIGILGNANASFKHSKVYSHIGLGVLIKNVNLIINTFQLSISYYPTIPGIGPNVIKLNSLETSNFGFIDFKIEKPAIVVYQ
jgi:hypothetical protein